MIRYARINVVLTRLPQLMDARSYPYYQTLLGDDEVCNTQVLMLVESILAYMEGIVTCTPGVA